LSVSRLLGYAALHLLPAAFLRRSLMQRLVTPGYKFSPRFSGRTALFELASAFRRCTDAPTALYPDYICNIVPRALNEAGWKTEAYPTDERLEADWNELRARLEHGDIGLLVGASVFGSSGLLDDLADPHNLAILRALKIRVIADLAQDVRLVGQLPEQGNDLISCVVSFNNKSFPGVMGGGILAQSPPAPPDKRMCRAQLTDLYKVMFGSSILKLRGRATMPSIDEAKRGFDYSYCESFPFRLTDNYRPAKLQLASAMLGLLMLDRYCVAKKALLDRKAHVETRFAAGAAYLVARDASLIEPGRKRKLPYAIEGDPGASLRPDHAIGHNKGFDDHV
jgi:hypothetical protein